jgi:DNA-nicking Smr family endonuclease
MTRRRRFLDPEEAALWERVARSASPLHGKRRRAPDLAPESEGGSAKPRITAKPAAPAKPRLRSPPAQHLAAVTVDPFDALAEAPSQLDGRRADRLRRGKLEPEARLDLHGLSRQLAHAALIDFVLASQSKGRRLVLVITGKGRPDRSDTVIPERTGILRHSVPHWLAAPPLTGRVVEVRPAHIRHGGGGALYLYLRRA